MSSVSTTGGFAPSLVVTVSVRWFAPAPPTTNPAGLYASPDRAALICDAEPVTVTALLPLFKIVAPPPATAVRDPWPAGDESDRVVVSADESGSATEIAPL